MMIINKVVEVVDQNTGEIIKFTNYGGELKIEIEVTDESLATDECNFGTVDFDVFINAIKEIE